MPAITLPDGSIRSFDNAISIAELAQDIGPGLFKASIAGTINGKLVDLSTMIENDANVGIITTKNDEAFEIIRHSSAHLLAQAVKQLYPAAQVTIGPVIDDGFFYDFAFERSFTPEDLEKIEKRMAELVKQAIPVERYTLSRDEAINYFSEIKEDYKAEIISSIPEDQTLSLYKQDDFTDLCRGPHVPNTSFLKAFKLTKIAGAYWRGNSDNAMLSRIYGTAWPDKKQLKAYLNRIEEAKKRDHRKIAKQMDLFHTQEEAPGMIFWHNNGWTINVLIQDYIRKLLAVNGYSEINTPQLVDRSLWEKSGHWDKFQEQMFTTSSENRDYAVKPMNCPCHIQVYNQGLKSYRDLPLRMAEFGSCHRNEPSGTLHGLMRVRNFVQDDAHIFCSEDQIQSEVSTFIDLVYKVYHDFGFENIQIALSTRPEKRVGEDALWDKAEEALKVALISKDIDYILQPGEGAFYGPKIEFSLKDCLDRVWQCGTMQVDFSMPGRLDAEYVGEDGERHVPVMLHRAILGSIERFIGILIEHYEGKFPTWLAPTQVAIIAITDRQAEYGQKIVEKIKINGFRCNLDLRNEKMGFKIREHTLARVPFMIIIGDREEENNEVSIRTQSGENLGNMSLDKLTGFLEKQCEH
jgi:threonyl-tRNA synthetase